MTAKVNKGIILAGGAGTRLYPLSLIASKQLQAVYDKPMIYYPLSMLMLVGVREYCLISTPQDIPRFEALLGDGSQWGIKIEYQVQNKPEGIAQAFIIADKFVNGENVALILGDNVFYGKFDFFRNAFDNFNGGATIFGYYVKDPERYGVVEFDKDGKAVSIEEKPKQPKSHYAVPGLYIYDGKVVDISKNLKPSARGELEITDVNRVYLDKKELIVQTLGRGLAWLDTGTIASLQEASIFIEVIEKRQGLKVSCPEEIALRNKFITFEQYKTLVNKMPKCEYSDYLKELFREFGG